MRTALSIMRRHRHPKHPIAPFLLSLILFPFITTNIAAQTGSLRGQVTDQNGAIVVGAKVTARGPSGQAKSSTSDSSGFYSFANLPAGDYTLEASQAFTIRIN
jgi:Carboxypeptidase regulatory-like domain